MLSMTHLLLGLLLSGHLPASRASFQEDPDPDLVSTRLFVSRNTPLLIDQEFEADVTLHLTAGGVQQSSSMDVMGRLQLLDEYQVIEDEREEATRTILRLEQRENGAVTDPPLAGTHYTAIREGDTWRVNLAEGRVLPRAFVDGFLRAVHSLGFWIHFPDAMRVGEAATLDLMPVASVLFGDDFEFERVIAQVVLKSFDPAVGAARFEGTVQASGSLVLDSFQPPCTFQGDVAIVTRPAERRVERVEFQGTMELAAEGPFGTLEGGGKLRSEVKTSLPANADALRRKQPKFRDAVRVASRNGVQLELPSYWAALDGVDGEETLYSSLPHEGEHALITFETIETKKNLRELTEELKQARDPKSQSIHSTSSPLGKGVAMITEREEDGRSVFIRTEYYPREAGRYLVFKLSGAAAACKHELKEFERARRTLKPVEPGD